MLRLLAPPLFRTINLSAVCQQVFSLAFFSQLWQFYSGSEQRRLAENEIVFSSLLVQNVFMLTVGYFGRDSILNQVAAITSRMVYGTFLTLSAIALYNTSSRIKTIEQLEQKLKKLPPEDNLLDSDNSNNKQALYKEVKVHNLRAERWATLISWFDLFSVICSIAIQVTLAIIASNTKNSLKSTSPTAFWVNIALLTATFVGSILAYRKKLPPPMPAYTNVNLALLLNNPNVLTAEKNGAPLIQMAMTPQLLSPTSQMTFRRSASRKALKNPNAVSTSAIRTILSHVIEDAFLTNTFRHIVSFWRGASRLIFIFSSFDSLENTMTSLRTLSFVYGTLALLSAVFAAIEVTQTKHRKKNQQYEDSSLSDKTRYIPEFVDLFAANAFFMAAIFIAPFALIRGEFNRSDASETNNDSRLLLITPLVVAFAVSKAVMALMAYRTLRMKARDKFNEVSSRSPSAATSRSPSLTAHARNETNSPAKEKGSLPPLDIEACTPATPTATRASP